LSNEIEQEKKNVAIDFAQLSKLIIADLNKNQPSSAINKKYSKEDIIRFLQNPLVNQKQLREVSNYLYNASPNYKRLILYFSCLLTFDYVVEPYGLNREKVEVDKFKKQYQKTLDLLEVMNIPHEFLKILKVAFREDVFYGYEHMIKDSYFIQKMNPDYCQISSIEDGVYNYAFNFSFFDQQANKDKLKKYPEEFEEKYKLYQNDKKKYKWQELSSENTVCIKINEDLDYPIPPFNTVFESVFDIEDYKRLKKTKTKIDNYMVLTHQIPMNENSDDPDSFLIELDTAIAFHNKASSALPEEVGLITSPMKMDAIKFDKNRTDADNVAQAERDYYNSAGVSQFLFNSEKATSVGLNKSVTTDEQILFAVLRQLERWTNRKLKNFNSTYKFRAKFLNTTVFNSDDVFEKYLKAAQYGFPVKQEVGATLGLSPSSIANKAFLENEILELHTSMLPVSSSHTQSGKDGVGAPGKKDDDLSEAGVKTRDTDGNIRE
jgi:hypothetical protein